VIPLKRPEEVVRIKKAGSIIGKVFDRLSQAIEPGVTTKALDVIAEKVIRQGNGVPAFKGYKGFPGNICTSINEVVVHGIPKNKVINTGDIISVDVGVLYDGYYADSAYTFKVGRVTKPAQRLMDVTREALFCGIREAVRDARLSNISNAVQRYVESKGYSIVRALVGHGIGQKLHEEPEIPNFGPAGKGPRLLPGMVLAIEPMVNEAACDVEVLNDGWAVATKDQALSAHFEHTVLVTEGKPEILTQWQKKKR